MPKIKIFLLLFILIFLFPAKFAFAAIPTINYQMLEPNAGVGAYESDSFYLQGNTTWDTNLPKLVTDGTYLYSLVSMGNQDTSRNGEMGLEIRRKRLNSNENFVTIRSIPSGLFRVVGALAMDKQNRLHFFYTSKSGPSGYLKHEIASSPQTNPVSFFPDSSLPIKGECRNCRLGLAYDNPTDSLYVVFDQFANSSSFWASSYLTVYKNGSWSTPEKIVDWPYLDSVSSTVFAYAYPKLIVFNNKLHIFFVGHPYSSTLKWLKSIIHYYQDLNSNSWNHEMIKDSPIPFASVINNPALATDQAFIYDALITRDGQLAIMGMYKTCPSGNCSIQTLEFVSASGVGGWQQIVISPDRNASPCVEKTSDGLYHMFKPRPYDRIEYAQSTNGKTWTDYPITNVPNISLIGSGCMEENGIHLDKAYIVLDGFSPPQNTSTHNMSNGHTVILGEVSALIPTSIPPTATPVPPTVTPVPGCACGIGDTCSSNCPVNTEANHFTTAPIPTYFAPMKCAQQDVNLYPTPPVSTDKNSFCNRQYRPKGDVDGDGHVTTQDYFYYVSAGNGGTLPANINTDVNGDGVTDVRDRAIIVRGRAAGI